MKMMKKNLFFMGLMLLGMSLGVVSCGDDDDNVVTPTEDKKQNHGAMNFVGTSTFYVVGMQESTTTSKGGDNVQLTLTGDSKKQAEIVIPDMAYNMNGKDMIVKSFTANSGVEYTMTGSYQTGDMAFEWAEGEFSTTTTGTDGNTKEVKGTISAKYSHTAKKLDVVVEFTYGAMPMAIHYELSGDYQKN